MYKNHEVAIIRSHVQEKNTNLSTKEFSSSLFFESRPFPEIPLKKVYKEY